MFFCKKMSKSMVLQLPHLLGIFLPLTTKKDPGLIPQSKIEEQRYFPVAKLTINSNASTAELYFAVLVVLVALALHIALNSPISPLPLSLPPSSSLTANKLIQNVEKLGKGTLEGPEDVCIDGEGWLYTVTRDGWIKRVHVENASSSSWEDWSFVGGPDLLGLALSTSGDILVCDALKGLLKVGKEGAITVLASQVESTKIRFADDAIEAADGSVYLSDASSKFGFMNWYLDLLEGRPNGRLLKYDPASKRTSIVLSSLTFPNGVALSSAQDFLVVCETWKFRCLKHWLKGEHTGKTEIFIENLQGGPDNINLAPDGSFWIALLQMRSPWMDLIHRSVVVKKTITAFPKLSGLMKEMLVFRGAAAVNVGSYGKMRRIVDDYEGKVMSFVTSALEFQGHLYLGNLGSDFIGKLSLSNESQISL